MYTVHVKYINNSEFTNKNCTATIPEILKDLYQSSNELEIVEVQITKNIL
jgi:hypothetical protein